MHSRLVSWGRAAFLTGLVLALVLVVPVAWFPFQLTKLAVFSVATAAAALLFVFGGGARELVRAHGFKGTFAVALLPVAYAFSAWFSTDPSVAWAGFALEADTVVFSGLLFVAFLLSFAFFRTQRTAQMLVRFVSGALLVAVVFQGFLLTVGSSAIPLDLFADRTTNLIGKWNDLGLLAALLALFALVRIEFGTARAAGRSLAIAGITALGLFLVVVNFTFAWILVLAFALALAFGKLAVRRAAGANERLPLVSGIAVVGALVCIFFGNTFNAGITRVLPVSSFEVRPSYEATLSVQAAAQENATRLFLGSGPNTFGQQWLLHKPSEVNQSLFWDVDFNVGFSVLLTAFGTVGVLGVAAWFTPLALALAAGLRAMRGSVLGREDRSVALMLVLGGLFMFAAIAFYVPSQNLILLAFVLLGAAFGFLWRQGRVHADTAVETYSLLQRVAVPIVVLILLAIVLIVGFIATRRLVSEAQILRGSTVLQTEGAAAALDIARRAVAIETTSDTLRFWATTGVIRLRDIAQDASVSAEEARASFETVLAETMQAEEQAAARYPNDYRTHVVAANLYTLLLQLDVEGAYDRALGTFTLAKERNPQNPAFALALARLEASRGNVEAAQSHLTEALTLKPNYTDAMLFGVQLSVAQDDIAGAIRAAAAAAQAAPGVAPVWFQLGLLYYTASDMASAIPALERAIAIVPDYANAKYFLGLAYYSQGRTDDAIRQFEHLAVTNPDNAEVKLILSNLRFGNAPFEGAVAPITNEPETRQEAPIEE